MADNNDKNGLVYLLAGFGLGTIFGAVAGVLFAPSRGEETREKLGEKLTEKFKDIKDKTETWVADRKKAMEDRDAAEKLGLDNK